ncbi:MAG: ABC transporter substrate-binding protein [Chelatococcus sp.]|uniref:ABC transporter substrate-binding protein n=1 Tax=Chelatococcus sp. TaxID=1953771 RepID=UPI0025BE8693|nr:ABC transporter substrate-binding protein [Chelatococcus sp.]MBX3540589.1 ABC transporter substrate-binding protein [Chelatococcus sp.]
MLRTLGIVAALAFGLGTVAQAQEGLVINGEKITSSELLAAAKKEGKIVHFGAYPQDAMEVVHKAFTADTGIETEYVRMSTAPLFQRILTEAQAGSLAADIVHISDIVMIDELVSKGVLAAPYKVTSFDALPAKLKDPEGRWYSFINAIYTPAINTARIREADTPKSWADLLSPKYAGQMGVVNIDGGAAFAAYTFLRQKVSPTYWADLAARKPRIYQSVAPLTTDLARGDLGVAVGSPEPFLLQVQAGAPLKLLFMPEGTPSFPVPGGITATAKHPNAAKVFLDWVTSKRGGDAVAAALAYGINPQSANPTVPGITYPKPSELWSPDLDKWRAENVSARDEWRKLFGK